MLFSAKKFNEAEKTRFVSLALVLIYFWQKNKGALPVVVKQLKRQTQRNAQLMKNQA
jgi:hypothetical protein